MNQKRNPPERNLIEAVIAYEKRFGEGPPIFGWDEHEAVAAIERALRDGKPLTAGAETQIPPQALL